MLAAAILNEEGCWLANLFGADELDTPIIDMCAVEEQIRESVVIQAMFRGAGWIVTPVPERA